jgi:uncharacterized membrane protein
VISVFDGGLRRRTLVVGCAVLACVLEVLPWHEPVTVTLAGLWLLFGAPAVLWRRITAPAMSTRESGWLVAVGLAVITAIVTALLVNTILPLLGVGSPLTTPILAIATTVVVGVLAAVDHRRGGASEPVTRPAIRLAPGLLPVAGLSAVCLVFAVAGPIRLNNGLGNTASMIALSLVAVLMGLLLVRHRRYGEGVTALGIVCAAAAVLLSTSLRGWYITGHDIQREYLVYQLTSARNVWNMASYRDAYNACLSITLLPTSLVRLTAVPGIYVFKVVLPLLFAMTPLLVYRTGRNVATKPVALLGAIYFIAFPTFFTDMTFLGRQEIAFLLLGCAVLVLTDRSGSVLARRIVFVGLLAGVVLSHYSTTYIIVGVLMIGKIAGHLIDLIRPLGRRLADRAPLDGSGPFIAWWMIGAVVLAAVLWTGPVTDTWQQVEVTAMGTAQNILDPGAATGSSDTGYSLFSGQKVTPQQRLHDYAKQTAVQTRSGRKAGAYEPQSTLDNTPIMVASERDLPLTSAGRALSNVGVNVAGLNNTIRTLCADALQLLLLIGLIGTVVATVRTFRPSRDLFVLAVGSLSVIAVETILPQLSVDYGVLRTFQQGLFFFAPFVAVASTWIFAWLRRWRMPLASAMALFFFLDLTGVLPELVGGYPAQLQLDNSGQYYDIYYLHAQERSSIDWLIATSKERGAVQANEVQTDKYTFSRLQTVLHGRASDDIYPTLVRTNAYVFLGYTTVTKDTATIFFQGDLVTYQYPIGFLDHTKDKLYSSDGASVYK